MSQPDLHLYLDSYLSVRETLGFQMRAERTLLRDLVRFVENVQTSGPIRAQLAVDWASASSSKRGTSGASQRLSMARGFLTYLRATLPDNSPVSAAFSFDLWNAYLDQILSNNNTLREEIENSVEG